MQPVRRLLCALLLSCAAAAPASAAPTPPALPPPLPLSGKVVETMNSGGYTYMMLENNGARTWAAVPGMQVRPGQEVRLLPGYEMKGFSSKTLNRTFDRIVFSAGPAEGQRPVDPNVAKLHRNVPAAAPAAPPAAAAPGTPTASAPPAGAHAVLKQAHAASAKPEPAMKGEKIAKAPGGYSIAQLHAAKAKLERKTVSVRGRVSKVSTGILKRNWIHLQDGSGNASRNTHTIIVTSKTVPAVGEVVVARGTVRQNIDLGSGYRYDVIIDDAVITAEGKKSAAAAAKERR
ncbi:MAG TPA: DNA-binding protein [Verrucomicrobiae bacterium]|nr:DNA-binding protein [Verrucomicrobiae bacterium]